MLARPQHVCSLADLAKSNVATSVEAGGSTELAEEAPSCAAAVIVNDESDGYGTNADGESKGESDVDVREKIGWNEEDNDGSDRQILTALSLDILNDEEETSEEALNEKSLFRLLWETMVWWATSETLSLVGRYTDQDDPSAPARTCNSANSDTDTNNYNTSDNLEHNKRQRNTTEIGALQRVGIMNMLGMNVGRCLHELIKVGYFDDNNIGSGNTIKQSNSSKNSTCAAISAVAKGVTIEATEGIHPIGAK